MDFTFLYIFLCSPFFRLRKTPEDLPGNASIYMHRTSIMHILLKYDVISVQGDSCVLQMVQFLCINRSKEFKMKVGKRK